MYTYQASLVSIHDGDTFHLDIDLGFHVHVVSEDMRIFGYDAPELGRLDKMGETARDWVATWFARCGNLVVVRTHLDRGDKFGRILAERIIASDAHELVADMVAAGYLRPYSGQGPKPWA